MNKIMSEERANYIAETLDDETPERAPEVEYRDPVKELGWAKIEHILTLDLDLTDGAYRTYALLVYYWQQKKTHWAKIDTMAMVRGVKESTIRKHLKELSDLKLISRQRRMGRSSLTHLEDLPERYTQAAKSVLSKRHNNRGKSAINIAVRESEIYPTEEEPLKKNQEEEPLGDSKAESRPPIPESIKIFREIRRSFPPKEVWSLIETEVGSAPAALDLWKNVLIGYAAMGWNPRNVSGALEYFRRGEIPHANGNGNRSGNGCGVPEAYTSPTEAEKVTMLEQVRRNREQNRAAAKVGAG